MVDEKKDKGNGFDGFNSMVSDLDKEIEEIGRWVSPTQSTKTRTPPSIPPARSTNEWPYPTPVNQSTEYSAPKPNTFIRSTLAKWSSRYSRNAWVWGAVFLVAIIWLGNENDQEAPRPNAAKARQHTYSPPASSYIPPASSYTPPPTQTYSTAQRDTEVKEERPPVGNGMKFNSAQIRYCLSESIRIDGMKGMINNYSEASVSSFNSYVNDYNARCSNFRYRNGLLETVRSEVYARRGSLESEGVNRALRNQ